MVALSFITARMLLDIAATGRQGFRIASKCLYRCVHKAEHIRQEDANRFECEDISKCYVTIEFTYCAVDGGHIATDVAHIVDEGPDDLHEDVRPDALIERAWVFDLSERLVDGLQYLLVKYLCRH